MKSTLATIVLLTSLVFTGFAKDVSLPDANAAFSEGAAAYASGEFAKAAQAFQTSAAAQPATGTLLNLGLAQWRRGRAGAAVLAWEKALWIDPSNREARQNLRFARQMAQLESPDLNWYESVSTRLSARAWAWLGMLSLWLAVAMMIVPRALRWRRVGWHQAVAASALAVFILTIPAQIGVVSRSRIGFVVEKKAELRLTPTDESETVSSLAVGEPIREVRVRGNFIFVRTTHGVGWVERTQLGMVCDR